MARGYRHALDDMLDAIQGISNATRGKTFDDYRGDWLLRRGVERGIEIVSEASRAVPPEVQARRADVPWREIRDIGNVLRHAYHGVSDLILWRVAIDELPALRDAVEALAADAAADDEDAT